MSNYSLKNHLGLSLLLFFSFVTCFSPYPAYSQIPSSEKGKMEIKAEKGLLSIKVENAPIPDVYMEIGRQTGLSFEGLDNIDERVTQEFENLPIEEGLRKISPNFILIFKKQGEKENSYGLQKVIVVAQKGMSETSSEIKTSQAPPDSQPLASPPAQVASSQNPPAIVEKVEKKQAQPKKEEPVSPPPSPKEKVSQNKNTTKSAKSQPVQPSQQPQPAVSPASPAPEPKTAALTPPAKPSQSSSSTALTSRDLELGEKYFGEKRWDRAIRHLKKHLEQNPKDNETEEKLAAARQNADQAISLYNTAKQHEEKGEVKEAYDYYKKAYDIYPLLYDTWEKMKALK